MSEDRIKKPEGSHALEEEVCRCGEKKKHRSDREYRDLMTG